MWDSNGHFPSGFLSGTVSNFGDYDQCIETVGSVSNTTISGKYCLMTIRPPRPPNNLDYQVIIANTSKYKNYWYEKEIHDWLQLDNVVTPFANGICFPSVCDRHQIRELLIKSKIK